MNPASPLHPRIVSARRAVHNAEGVFFYNGGVSYLLRYYSGFVRPVREAKS